MTDRLQGPRLKIERAKTHIGELEGLVSAFFATEPYEALEEMNPATGKNRAWVRINAEPDPSWSLVIGDVLHNLRSALDLLYCQLLTANGVTPRGSDWFPIHDTQLLFDKGSAPVIKKRAGRRAFEIFRDSIKPYRGGNNALWCLHQLDIIGKHRLLLVVAAANPALIVSIEDEAGNELLSHAYPTTTSWPLKDGDPLPAGTRIAEGSIGDAPKMEMKHKAAFVVTIYEPKVIGIPEPSSISIGNMTGAVEQTIELLGTLF